MDEFIVETLLKMDDLRENPLFWKHPHRSPALLKIPNLHPRFHLLAGGFEAWKSHAVNPRVQGVSLVLKLG